MPTTPVQPPEPEDELAGMSDEQLNELLDGYRARADEIRGMAEEEWTDEVVAEAEAIAADSRRVSEALAGRADEKAQRAERTRSALGEVGSNEEPEETEEPEAEPEAPVAEADDPESEDAETPEPALVSSPAVTRPRAEEALQRARAARAKVLAPRPQNQSFMEATIAAYGYQEGSPLLDVASVAQAITKKRHSFGNVPSGSREYVPVATGTKAIPDEDTVSIDPMENYGVLQRVAKQHTSLVASGGCCAPFTPLYDFFRTAEEQTPIEDALPVVNAPRGGIRFIQPPDWRNALSAIGTRTCTEDANPATPDKPCVHVTCPSTTECSVVAVSQCVQFGNLGYRVFPEQVQAFLADVAVAFALRKETMYLSVIDGCSTQVSAASVYGASRAATTDIIEAGVQYRKRNAMSRTATLQGLFPDWWIDLVKMDMVNDNSTGLEFLNVPDADVVSAIRSQNVDPVFYNDLQNWGAGATIGIAKAQAAGAINPMPSIANWWLFAPGSFVRLDGGQLDVGLVRDSLLNAKNDLELFMEEWTGVCCVGIEAVNVVSNLCWSGAAPALTTLMTCPK